MDPIFYLSLLSVGSATFVAGLFMGVRLHNRRAEERRLRLAALELASEFMRDRKTEHFADLKLADLACSIESHILGLDGVRGLERMLHGS